jgi:hypothetical protein
VLRDDFGESDSFFENEIASKGEPASQKDVRAKVRLESIGEVLHFEGHNLSLNSMMLAVNGIRHKSARISVIQKSRLPTICWTVKREQLEQLF